MKILKTINRLKICPSFTPGMFSVYTPDKKCWEDNLSWEQAVDFCQNTKNFVQKPISKEDEKYLNQYIKVSEEIKDCLGKHKQRFPSVGKVCAYYYSWEDLCDDWETIGYTRFEIRKLFHAGKGEFKKLPNNEGIVRFEL